ncbi:MAG: hypothetical protein ACI32C_01550 [Candidatus Enteromonas sp.]
MIRTILLNFGTDLLMFLLAISAGNPVAIAIGVIIALLVSACLAIIITMVVHGYIGKGFAVGWFIHSLFDWEWYGGDLK